MTKSFSQSQSIEVEKVGFTYLVMFSYKKEFVLEGGKIFSTSSEEVYASFDDKEEAYKFASNMDNVCKKTIMRDPAKDPLPTGVVNPHHLLSQQEKEYSKYILCGTWYEFNSNGDVYWVKEVGKVITCDNIIHHFYPWDKNNPKEKHLYNSLHNTKGPAIEIPDPRFKKYFPFVYYLYGVPYTHQEYLDALFLLGID